MMWYWQVLIALGACVLGSFLFMCAFAYSLGATIGASVARATDPTRAE